jgi:hypothetical protein
LGWSRALYRPVAAWDHVLDTLDSRVTGRVAAKRRPPGKWGSYFLGRPLERSEDDAGRT